VPAAPSTLTATRRAETGKKVAALRRAGRVPAVVFGHGIESMPVSLDAHEFDLLRKHLHSSSMLDLMIDGETQRVLVHGIQVDPRTRQLLHVDLFAIKSGEEVTVDIPIVTVGESEAVEKHQGVLLHQLDRLHVRALPERLPERFEVSIESLVDFDHAIHVRDIAVPEGVTLLTDIDEVVVKAVAPHRPEAAPVAEVPAEGEAVPTEEGPTSGSDRPDRGAPEG
jgi:large subunit ribosomal protein L25